MPTPVDPHLIGLKAKIQQLHGPILVLGASGFVGANLFRALVEHRDDVTGAIGELPAWRLRSLPDQMIRPVDALDDSQLDALLEDVDPNIVFDCVAYGAYPFEVDPQRIYETNFQLLTRLLPRLADHGIAAYVHAGTSSEYGMNAAGPLEEAFTAPNSDYAVSKIAAAH